MATAARVPSRSASLADAGSISAPVVFLGRLLFVLIFLMAGFSHFAKATNRLRRVRGCPDGLSTGAALGPACVLRLSILLGYRAKIGAWLIVLFLLGVTPLHKFWGISDPMMQQMQMVLFMKNIAMLGAAMLITQFGSGPWSLDARQK